MRRSKIVLAVSMVLIAASIVSAESVRDMIIRNYGLNRLAPQNRDDVAMWIEFGGNASQALDNCGLQVLVLDRIIRGNVPEKYMERLNKPPEYCKKPDYAPIDARIFRNPRDVLRSTPRSVSPRAVFPPSGAITARPGSGFA